MPETIRSPCAAALDPLLGQLAALSARLDIAPGWPVEQLELCAAHGVYEWFVPPAFGGQGWTDADITRGYLALAKACLTTTFILTQRTAACQRIAASGNERARAQLLPPLARTAAYATVAVSHLSTSRRHLERPILRAVEVAGGYELDGYSAWVTGAVHAQTIVAGATLDDGRQILVALPARARGMLAESPAQLVGLTSSQTGVVRFERVLAAHEQLLFGPAANVMQATGGGTGGLQTSTLAVGLADAALEYVEIEARRRPNLHMPVESLRQEWTQLRDDLLAVADGRSGCSAEELRTRANSLVLRATQAALVTAKGTGYVVGHPAGRWCREALFFLVWSCPQPVTDAHLCELAGLGGANDD